MRKASSVAEDEGDAVFWLDGQVGASVGGGGGGGTTIVAVATNSSRSSSSRVVVVLVGLAVRLSGVAAVGVAVGSGGGVWEVHFWICLLGDDKSCYCSSGGSCGREVCRMRFGRGVDGERVRVVIEVEGKREILCCKSRRVNKAAAVIVVEYKVKFAYLQSKIFVTRK